MSAVPLGALANVVLRTAAARPEDAGYFEEIERSLASLQGALNTLRAAEKKGGLLPLPSIETVRFEAQRVQGLATFLLKRAMDGARRERSTGYVPLPSPCPALLGAEEAVPRTSAPSLSDPCPGLPLTHAAGDAAGASAQPRAPARIRENAGAPNPSEGEA